MAKKKIMTKPISATHKHKDATASNIPEYEIPTSSSFFTICPTINTSFVPGSNMTHSNRNQSGCDGRPADIAESGITNAISGLARRTSAILLGIVGECNEEGNYWTDAEKRDSPDTIRTYVCGSKDRRG